jgi:hypothetical protein
MKLLSPGERNWDVVAINLDVALSMQIDVIATFFALVKGYSHREGSYAASTLILFLVWLSLPRKSEARTKNIRIICDHSAPLRLLAFPLEC